MSANDELDPPVSSATSVADSAPATQPESTNTHDKTDDDTSWMDEPLNLVPPKSTETIMVNVVHGGRGTPLPYPDPLAEYEELFGPIDVHSLNVDPGEESFTVVAKVEHLGWMEPLPYPDPLGDREEEADD